MECKKKSKFLTYLLWLLGGFFGLHHFYLGRDMQGFLWLCTLGGYFGCGWLRDVFHLEEYVADANQETDYIKRLKDATKRDKKPPFSATRFIGMVVVAYLWSTVYSLAIPEENVCGLSFQWLHIFTPLACALGVWSVGNVGHQKGGLMWPLLTAYGSLPLKYVTDESSAFTLMVLISAFAFDTFAKKWRPKYKRRASCLKRTSIILGCWLLYLSLWCSYFYFNAKITDVDGEEIPIREALYHFFNSPWWVDVEQSFVEVWLFAQHHGWWEVWKQIIDLTDPTGEYNAYKVLDLPTSASQNEINAKCRSLAVKYHPDKFKLEEEKKTAQERFFEIQQSCELLSSSRAKRRRRNKKFSFESD